MSISHADFSMNHPQQGDRARAALGITTARPLKAAIFLWATSITAASPTSETTPYSLVAQKRRNAAALEVIIVRNEAG